MNGSIQRRRGDDGFVLVVSLLVMAVLSVLTTVFLWTAQTETTIATNYRNQAVAFHAAEAGIESGLVSLRSLLRETWNPSDQQLVEIEPPELNNAYYTFSDFQVTRVRATPPYDYRSFIATGPYTGLNANTTDYRITAVVTGPRASQARLSQTAKHLRIPLFQFGVFYGEGVDLEVHPGAAFDFAGRVHANSNIYMYRDSGSPSMKFDSYITAVGNFYHKSKMSGNRRYNPQVKVGEDGGGNPIYAVLNFDREAKNIWDTSWQPSNVDEWRAEALSRFGGRVQDSAHEVELIQPPIPDVLYDPDNPTVKSHLMIEKGAAGDSAAEKEAKIYYQAGLRIENGAAIEVTDGNANNINLTALGCHPQTISNKTFYDAREGKNIQVTEVNVGMLKACNQAPANGVLYVSHNGANKGVRLVNGSELPSQGLTVVSENPVYIQGDYNTVNKVPAAVLGDAITALSNDWNDANSDKALSDRKATETTVNAAFALGPHAESNPATASNGQFNNVIRFLEHWGGVPFNYKGSVVALWHSQQVTAPWSCCTYYNPPIRNWSYDTDFDTDQPPGTPMGILQRRGQWSSGG